MNNIKEKDFKDTNDSELIMLYKEDDENAKDILYTKYKYIMDILIRKYQKQLFTLGIDKQEIYSECAVGFSDGLKSYQDDKNTTLKTFITFCIERRFNNLIRKYNRDKYKVLKDSYSLDYTYDDVDIKFLDTIIDDKSDPLNNITEYEDYKELINKIRKSLTKQEYEVFLLLNKGINYLEIAEILKKTPKQIDNTRQRIKIKLKKILELV